MLSSKNPSLHRLVLWLAGRTQGYHGNVLQIRSEHKLNRICAAIVFGKQQISEHAAMPDLEFKDSMSGCIFVLAQLRSCFRSCLLGLSHPLPQVTHFFVAGPSLQLAHKVYLHALLSCPSHTWQ